MIESPVRKELTSYLPHHLLKRLSRAAGKTLGPETESFQAAVLFADVSGFTALTQKLAASGAEGTEDLTTQLNEFYGELVTIIQAHGGDIAKFAGDALLVIWDATHAAFLNQAILRATACALAIQRQMAGHVTQAGDRLSLRIAVSGGPLRIVHVGGIFDRWEYVLAGPPVIEVGQIAGLGEPGDITINRQAYEPLAAQIEAVELSPQALEVKGLTQEFEPTPLLAPQIDSVPDSQLLSYLPGAIRSRLKAGHNLWLAELRLVTVLFVSLPSHDGSVPLDNAQELMQDLQRDLYRYEGSVNKLSVDDKGSSMLAALGLPPLAHQDDAVRALCAAIDIRSTFARHGVVCNLGVATGHAFCGVVGSPARREYTMIGDVVNLAARLMQSSNGEVVCDPETRRLAARQFDFDTLPAVKLKGKSEPIVRSQPRRRLATVRRRALSRTMIARETELELIEQSLDSVESRASTALVFEGTAGIGKSLLLDELDRGARRRGLVVYSMNPDAIERSTPYYCWRSLVEQIFGLENIDEPEQRRALVEKTLGADAKLAPLLDGILPLDLPDNQETAALTPELRKDHLEDLLLKVMTEATDGRPWVLCVDDAHWLDSASWSLLKRCGAQVPALLIALVTRAGEAGPPPECASFIAITKAHHHRLEPLERGELELFIRTKLGVDRSPSLLTDYVWSRALGNPYYAEQLLYTLQDEGFLSVRGKAASLTRGLDELSLPDTVKGLMTQRIDQLPPAQQLSLKVASVIGRDFRVETLAAIFPETSDAPQLETTLERLRGTGLLVRDANVSESSYRFAQRIVEKVCYELMSFALRRELHTAIGDYYEARAEADLVDRTSLLAHHYHQAGDLTKASLYYERAGTQALASHANEEARAALLHVLALSSEGATSEPERQITCEQQLGEACYALSDHEGGREHLRKALELMKLRFPAHAVGCISGLVREVLRRCLRRIFGAPRVSTGDEAIRYRMAARAHERLAQLEYMDNDKFASVYGGVRGLNLAERLGPSPELARNYANVAVAASMVGWHDLADRYERHALTIAGLLNDDSCHAYALELCALHRCGLGQWLRAERYLLRSLPLAENVGDHRRLAECLHVLGTLLLRRGRYRELSERFEALLESGTKRRHHQLRAWALAGLVAAAKQRPEAVRPIVKRLENLIEARPNGLLRTDEIHVTGLLAAGASSCGSIELGQRAAHRVAKLSVGAEILSHYLLEGFAGAAEFLLNQAEETGSASAQALTDIGLLSSVLYRYARVYPIGEPQALLTDGRLSALKGQQRRARQRFISSVKAATRLSMPFEEARASRGLAETYPRGDRLRHQALELAKQLFAELDAPLELTRLSHVE